MGALLDVWNLTKQSGGLTAVDSVIFELQEGKILGQIGPNGAGTTAIFNMITGFYTPTKGEIYFKGVCIARPRTGFAENLRGSRTGRSPDTGAGDLQAALLMIDEPSLGLAPLLVRLIFETIQEINARGVTVLLVEQNARAALKIAHRAYVLETGRCVLAGRAADLLQDERVRKSYLGER